MRVQENGRGAGRRGNVAEDRGHALYLDDLRFAAGVAQDPLGRARGAAELGGIVPWVADRWDAHERFEVHAEPWHEVAHALTNRRRRLGLHGRKQPTLGSGSVQGHNAAGSILLRVRADTPATLT